jgi:endonuclease G
MKTKPLTFLLAAACALALTGCDKGTLPGAAPKQVPAAVEADPVTGFEQCRHFFPGMLPRVPELQKRQPRDLCYDAFAILHSGQSKTPVFVVERLTREQLHDAADEERTNRFFADARLPSAERATLEDYRGSGYDRGHMQYPVSRILNFSFASGEALSRPTQSAYSISAPLIRA